MEISIKDINKIREYQERMQHDFDPIYYKNRALFVNRIGLPKLFFNDIIINGVENVRKVQDKQIVYVSNHTSMADYLVQAYIFWKENLPIPRFLAGENLNRIILGKFFRKCGAIYIDRDERDRLYWRFEDYYIKEEVLSKNENLIFYPEGTRNDSLAKKLKTGTFGQVMDIVEDGKDTYVVPVYVAYDKRIEEGVLNKVRENKAKRDELLKKSNDFKRIGKNFRARMFELRAKYRDKLYFDLDLAAYFVRAFNKDKGNAYVYFGEAFSIKQFLEENENVERFKKKFTLAEIVRQEIGSLENLYKASKSD